MILPNGIRIGEASDADGAARTLGEWLRRSLCWKYHDGRSETAMISAAMDDLAKMLGCDFVAGAFQVEHVPEAYGGEGCEAWVLLK